jgi:hypothetical protein
MKTLFILLLGAILGIAILPYLLFRQKEMPEGTDLKSPGFSFNRAKLLIDRTSWDAAAHAYIQTHEIFDSILSEIRDAETFLIADFFLWNPWSGAIEGSGALRPLANELANALIEKRIQNPDMPIVIITDPINRIYGDHAPEFYDRLADAGIPVVFTDLSRLPDSNKVFAPQASFWSHFFSADDSEDAARPVPNPFNLNGEKLAMAQLGRLLHFKANHRKVLIAGHSNGANRLILCSFNPADGSANHSNIGAFVEGAVATYAARSELQIAEWSSATAGNVNGGLYLTAYRYIAEIRDLIAVPANEVVVADTGTVAWRSEEAIRDELIAQLDSARAHTQVDLAIFYFSDRLVTEALRSAIERGAQVRVLLDPNRDAFGRQKNGIPNRAVAAELMKLAETHSIDVRWAATHGEQYHAKALRVIGPAQDSLFLGSANWTRRNIGNLNLEANLLFSNAEEVGAEFDAYFDSIWNNSLGFEESLPYEDWAENGWSLRWKTWLYRFQEWSGASTF